jgi:hypothetical protein
MSGFPLLLGGKQTFGELPQNDANGPTTGIRARFQRTRGQYVSHFGATTTDQPPKDRVIKMR